MAQPERFPPDNPQAWMGMVVKAKRAEYGVPGA